MNSARRLTGQVHVLPRHAGVQFERVSADGVSAQISLPPHCIVSRRIQDDPYECVGLRLAPVSWDDWFPYLGRSGLSSDQSELISPHDKQGCNLTIATRSDIVSQHIYQVASARIE